MALRPALLNKFMLPLLAGTLVLAGSLLNFLTFYSYPLLSWEVGMALSVFLLVAFVCAVLYSGRRFWGRAFFEVLLLFILIDLHFDSPRVAIVACCGVLIALILKRMSLLPLLAITGCVMVVASILGLSAQRDWIETTRGFQGKSTSRLPAIVHIILDEQIGVAGAAFGRGGMSNSETFLREFYLNQGFNVFERAYSEHLQTVNSIPNILNFGEASATKATHTGAVLGPTRYFQMLTSRGYALNILQSDYIDYCKGANYTSCTSYLSPSPQLLPGTDLAVEERTALLLYKFFSLSEALVIVSKVYDVFAGLSVGDGATLQVSTRARTNSLVAYAALDHLIEKLKSAQIGEAYVAHILLPHDPYLLTEDCKLLPRAKWLYRFSDVALSDRERAYVRQLTCTTKMVGQLLNAISLSPAADNSVIIIHGDHGSRIVSTEPLTSAIGDFTQADLVAAFSTLFVVKLPGQEGMVITKPAPLPELLKSLVMANFATIPTPLESPNLGQVFLSDDDWKPSGTTMLPPDWRAPTRSASH